MTSKKRVRKRVLVVDDEYSTRRLFCRFFETEGWATVAVSRAAEAVGSVQKGSYTLVLTDTNLGRGPEDGIALAKELRVMEPGLRIIIMSGDIFAEEAAKSAGFNEFVRKGAGFSQLEGLLKR